MSPKNHSLLVVIAGSASLAFPMAASAQSRDIEAVIDCRSIANDLERLACFDAAASALAERAGDLVVVERQELEAVERDGFGLELPSLPRLSLSIFGSRTAQSDLEVTQSDISPDPATVEADAVTSDAVVLERTDDGQIDRVRLQVASVERRGYGDVFFTMTNGQVWEVVGGPRLQRLPDPARRETFVEIRRAAVQSYLMRINGVGAAYRVQRR